MQGTIMHQVHGACLLRYNSTTLVGREGYHEQVNVLE